ncbi:MAG: roadblock/LC7 domain-containing protein [Thermoplasmata archaeon]|nr:roadblock/LC7 domain-containing protein [Thermoplasmata archaeon]
MVSTETLEPYLDEIKKVGGVNAATIVSRSGMRVAGEVPSDTHMETFVAMSAIVLGASETAASELKETLKYVEIRSSKQKILLIGIGGKGILALTIAGDIEIAPLQRAISDIIGKLKKALK